MNRAQRRRQLSKSRKPATAAHASLASAEDWLNQGNALSASGQLVDAEAAYREALELNPHYTEALSNLGSVLQALDRLKEAERAFRQALKYSPGNASVLTNLGVVLEKRGDADAAIACHREAVESEAEHVGAHRNLAALLADTGESDEAIAVLRQAIGIDPGFAEGRSRLGALLKKTGALAEALEVIQRALELDPELAEAHNELGNVLLEDVQVGEAVKSYRNAVRIAPDYPLYRNNLAVALRYTDRSLEAADECRKVLAGHPDNFDANNILGDLLVEFGEPVAALEHFERAWAKQPDDLNIRHNRAYPLLVKGDWEAGYEALEYRWQGREKRPFTHPEWDGSGLTGKSLLVWSEQGVGDTVLFASCLGEAAALAARCVFETDIRLVPLFARSFPEIEVVSFDDPPDPRTAVTPHDFQAPVGSLPRWLRRGLDSFPTHHGYLKADPEAVAAWHSRLAQLGEGPKIGIVWRSSILAYERQRHYSELAQWAPLLSMPGAHFVNLQYGGDPGAEIAEVERSTGVAIHNFADLDPYNDIDGSVALLEALDLLISPESSTAWLAGALGKTAWVMCLPGDWRMLGTEHLPWLPSVRMIVKPVGDSWDTVIGHLAQELRRLLASVA